MVHKNIKVIQISPKPVYENSMRGLQIAVDQKIQELNRTCKRCDNEKKSNYKFCKGHISL